MSVPRTFCRIVLGLTLAGFVVGTFVAGWSLFASGSVREFQATGATSQWGERLWGLVHRAAIEGVGFAAVGVAIAVATILLTKLVPAREEHDRERVGAAFVLACAGFYAWASFGAWLGNEALPYLGTRAIWLLNTIGFVGAVIGFWLYLVIGRLLPWGRGIRPLAGALSAALCAGAGAFFGVRILEGGSDGWMSPIGLLKVAGLGAFGLALVGPVARSLQPLASALLAWWSRPAPIPTRLVIALAVLLFGSILSVAPTFSLSSSTGEVRYKTLTNIADSQGPNVVLITIDTLRAQSLGTYGYERPTSPFLDALAAKGTVMLDASAPAAWTKPTTGTILTGLYPSRHGALQHGSPLRTPDGHKTLAETFQDEGFVTAGFVTNPNIKAIFDFDRGFDEYFDSPVDDTIALASIRASMFGGWLMNLSRHQFNWKYENDVRQMNSFIFPWLEKNKDSRFFLYLHYIDPHAPYAPPEEFGAEFRRDAGMKLFNARKEIVGLDLYDGEIRYTDEGMKELVAKFEELDIWDNTLFVLTADHGEEFFEHGVLGHGFSLFQPVIGVPLIFHGPGVPAGGRIETPVQIVDMPATILDLAETGQTEIGDGSSFRPLFRGEQADRLLQLENEFGMEHNESESFVFEGVREGKFKLVLTSANKYFPPSDLRYKDDAQALYDLATDPNEEHNLIREPEHKERVERMLDSVLTHQKFRNEEGLRDGAEVELDDAMREQLQALGYLGGE